VGVIYLSPITRPRPGLDRNSGFVIQARVRGVTVITMLCVGITSAVVHYSRSPSTWWSTLELMGIAHITLQTVWDILRALLLAAVLFQGPMVERICSGTVGTGEGWAHGRLSWVGWRNFVVVCHSTPPPLHTPANLYRAVVNAVAGDDIQPVVFIGASHGGDCIPRLHGSTATYRRGITQCDSIFNTLGLRHR